MNSIPVKISFSLVLLIFLSPKVNAYFGDEFDLALFPEGSKTMTALQFGTAGMLKSKKITSATTIDKILNQEFFISTNIDNFNIGFSFKQGRTAVTRNVYPKKINTRAQNYRLWLGSKPWKKSQWRSFFSYQTTDLLQLQCYAMASRIVGGNCDDAEFRFLNPDKTRNDDGSLNTVPVLNTKVQANIIGIELRRELFSTNNFRLASQVRFQSARIEHDISSPLFTMRSPVLLDFKVNGKPLRQLRDEFANELPQTNPWYEHNASIGISGARSFYNILSIEAGIAYTKVLRNDYEEHPSINEITDNFRLDVSFIWAIKSNMAIYLKGFAASHNTLGYEPIAYNRKSSSQFDKKYGEVAMGFLKFW